MNSNPTRVLAVQLRGDVSLLPIPYNNASLSDEILNALTILGSAAKIARCWVGVSAPHVISQVEKNFPLNPLIHSMAWMRTFGKDSVIAKCFREAEKQGLVTISNGDKGYFYEPTQALADLMLGR